MTLLDALRDRVRPIPEPEAGAGRSAELPDAGWWAAPAAGALAAAGSWLVLALPALVVWVASGHTTVSWGEALGVASAGWFLGHGASVSVEEATIWLAPLGVWLLALAVTLRGARRLLDRSERAAPGTTWPALLVRRVVPGFVLGYAAVAGFVWLLALVGPARPGALGAPLALMVPVLAMAWALLRRYLEDEEAGVAGSLLDRLPWWLSRALRPGVHGAGIALGVGTALVAVMVVARWSTVAGLHAAVDPGLVGGVALTAGQVLLLPNLAVWALGWLAGPGFQIADGAGVTLRGAHPGLMPMVPALGALPSDGAWSGWLLLLLAVPAVTGAVIGWLACRTMARLASWRAKAAAAVSAAATAALILTLLAALGSGPVGVDRLRDVGTNPLLVGAALLGELAVGAGAYVLVDQLRLRLRRRVRR